MKTLKWLCVACGAVLPLLAANCSAQVQLRITTPPGAVAFGPTQRVSVTAPAQDTPVSLVMTLNPTAANEKLEWAKTKDQLSQTAVSATVDAAANTATFSLPMLELDRELTIEFKFKRTTTGQNTESVVATTTVFLDSKPPRLRSPSVEVTSNGTATITLDIADSDIRPVSVSPDSFQLYEKVQVDGQQQLQNRPRQASEAPRLLNQNRQVKIVWDALSPGDYELRIQKLADIVGNALPDFGQSSPQESFQITIPNRPQRAAQPEYPRFLAERNRPSELNPGDRVDTRVVQLYYLRDARQVAELINRNIQDLNAVSWDAAQRAAADARKRAEEAIDNRRFQDERAVEAARRARETENQLQEAQEELREVQRDQAALKQTKAELEAAAYRMMGKDSKDINAEITSLIGNVGTNRTEISRLNAEISDAKKKLEQQENAAGGNPNAAQAAELMQTRQQIANLETQRDNKHTETTNLINKANALRTLQGNIDAAGVAEQTLTDRKNALTEKLKSERLPSELAQRQQTEIAERQKVGQAEASELRASQEQFRREVAAGLADRNSYARGNLDSVDPVAQVSISVVGTSRLQLRGPIKGLNKICRMIHQLDSPVGQVKIGIHTIQMNGEHGDRMDVVYERINREVAHSRFLVNASGQLLRRAVQEVADEVAIEADAGILPPNCPPELQIGVVRLNGSIQTSQELRNRRYLYSFYGSDFIGELEEMDSELLNTDNKLLSLHSMDTISLPGAMFVLAHADHPVRHRVLMRFQELIAGDLPMREMEFVRALTQLDSCGKPLKYNPNRANKIDEREARAIMYNNGRTYTFPNTVTFFSNQIQSQGTLSPVQFATVKLAQALKAQLVAEMEYKNLVVERTLLRSDDEDKKEVYLQSLNRLAAAEADLAKSIDGVKRYSLDTTASAADLLLAARDNPARAAAADMINRRLEAVNPEQFAAQFYSLVRKYERKEGNDFATNVARELERSLLGSANNLFHAALISEREELLARAETYFNLLEDQSNLSQQRQNVQQESAKALVALDEIVVAEQLMDDQDAKAVELLEALREQASDVDNYLKRLAIVIEDDVAAQFYEPAFQRIRNVSRTWDITLGQIETTTILTNNRTLAKVSPAASFEFDLPKRKILITEAMQGAKALADEYGNLLNDPTFNAGTELLRARSAEGIAGNNGAYDTIPGINNVPEFGSELDKLIEPPAIYKFETGTGFEIRPVIQPDGNSVMYSFDYEYSTAVREPVRADEKHLGRIKRHFVRTEVQTSSYELREISRYTVALKAARTDRGVPLFQDIPVIGQAFRPLPSDESALQTNIILGSSTVYPTVFDLMGLRWSPYVDGEGSSSLAEEKRRTKDRADAIRNKLRDKLRSRVDETLDIK
jgi:hypothetical protein